MSAIGRAEEKAGRAAGLPTGTVTFLFTDIEGSTQRWERHREAMKAAVARHEHILGAAISQHGGCIFKTVGDAFCAAFATAQAALCAARDAQLALAQEDFSDVGGLSVRMGLHTGSAHERNADYFGPAVNRVARLMSVGHGGQVLISGITRDLAFAEFPSGTAFEDLGFHRLKDLAEPEHIWQLTIAGLTSKFPALLSLPELSNNLPLQPSSFYGREEDLHQVKHLLQSHRLLTIMGAGGVGKTRLAVQAGGELLERFRDGVWFADIAPITDPKLVSSVVGNALGMNQVEGRSPDESISHWLQRKQLLLIIDNCEHLLGAVAALADSIQRVAPHVRILTTSRQALGISGEAVYRLPSLAVPEQSATVEARDALRYGAIAVFVDRATLADNRFVLSDDNAPIVAEICRRLDGIPLAIELAAARTKVLSIPNLAQRLNERFKLLTGGSRVGLPRQKTLAALIDWSYDLLDPQEQLVFQRLGMFAGGFTFDAAMAVCSGEGVDEIGTLDILTSLSDKSLVLANTCGDEERYRLLESTRAYALEKLASQERARLARRHAEYFRNQAELADREYGTRSTLAWLADVETELDNYRAALEWALTQGNDAVIGAAIAGALEVFWFLGGLSAEGRYWIGSALDRVPEEEQQRVVARLWMALAYLYTAARTFEAAERAVTLYRKVGDERSAARAQVRLTWALYQMGRLDEAAQVNEGVLATLRGHGERRGVALCTELQAAIAYRRGDTAAGRELYQKALAAFESVGDELESAIVLGNLAEIEFADGHPEAALRFADDAAKIYSRGRPDMTSLAIYRSNCSLYRIALGDFEGAHKLANEGLQFACKAQYASLIAIVLQHVALLMALRGSNERAARLLGYVDAQYHRLSFEREPTEKWGSEKLRALLRTHLTEREIAALQSEGAQWSEDQALEEARRT